MNTGQLVLSIGTLLLTARALGWIFHRIGQPRVVGEITAGIILGPSLLGRLFPAAFAYIFPQSFLPILTALSQLGVLLFMFVLGLEVDVKRIFQQRIAVVLVSNSSIVLPFVLGLLLAKLLYTQFSGKQVAFSSFALFVGTALSITAFPVLARILKEQNLLQTDLGTMAVSCAAIDDVSAWLLLAVITAMVHSGEYGHSLMIALMSLTVFVAVMLGPIRSAAHFLASRYQNHGPVGDTGLISFLVLFMFAASWMTERAGVHALFGAFVAGLAMPKHEPAVVKVGKRLESVCLALLLPLFFALVGLRTYLGLISSKLMWGYTLAILLTAVTGKLMGAALAAKITGMHWKDSLGLGVLMNTRGLVELVVLNAGVDLGILSPALFTMMVLMALGTTFMTTPLLAALKIQRPSHEPVSVDSRVLQID